MNQCIKLIELIEYATDKEKYQENPFKQDVANKRTGYSKLIGQLYV